MAQPIKATPTIKGRDAEKIWYEMEHGTPSTPERVKMVRDSDEVYRQATERARKIG